MRRPPVVSRSILLYSDPDLRWESGVHQVVTFLIAALAATLADAAAPVKLTCSPNPGSPPEPWSWMEIKVLAEPKSKARVWIREDEATEVEAFENVVQFTGVTPWGERRVFLNRTTLEAGLVAPQVANLPTPKSIMLMCRRIEPKV